MSLVAFCTLSSLWITGFWSVSSGTRVKGIKDMIQAILSSSVWDKLKGKEFNTHKTEEALVVEVTAKSYLFWC